MPQEFFPNSASSSSLSSSKQPTNNLITIVIGLGLAGLSLLAIIIASIYIRRRHNKSETPTEDARPPERPAQNFSNNA